MCLGEMLGYHCTGENQGKLVKTNSEQEMTSQEMYIDEHVLHSHMRENCTYLTAFSSL